MHDNLQGQLEWRRHLINIWYQLQPEWVLWKTTSIARFRNKAFHCGMLEWSWSSALPCLCTCPSDAVMTGATQLLLLSVQTPKCHGRDTGQQHHTNWLSKSWLPLKAMLPFFRCLWVPGGGLAAKKKPGNQVQSSVTESLCTTEYVPGASHTCWNLTTALR